MKLVVYVSGNLAAQTMSLIIKEILKDPAIDLTIISDGEIFDETIAQFVKAIDISTGDATLPPADCFMVAPRTPGYREGEIAATYRARGARIIGICSDFGSGPEKFLRFPKLPHVIALPDAYSQSLFVNGGVPASLLRAAGSPYLDSLDIGRTTIPKPDRRNLCFLEVPNAWDWECRQQPIYYDETYIATKILAATGRTGFALTYRRHPLNQFKKRFISGIEANTIAEQEPILEFLGKYSAVLSTYSTTLLLARLMGLPAISFQPRPAPILRPDIFHDVGVQIAKTPDELCRLLDKLGGANETNMPCKPFWYAPASGLTNIMAIIKTFSRQ